MGGKKKNIRLYQGWTFYRWADKQVPGLGPLQNMQLCSFQYGMCHHAGGAPWSWIAQWPLLTRVTLLHIFLLFSTLYLIDFFKALNCTVSPQTIKQVTYEYGLFSTSRVLIGGCFLSCLGSQSELWQQLPAAYPSSSLSSSVNGALIYLGWQCVQTEAYSSHHS